MATKGIEERLDDLTDALNRNSDLLEKLLSKTAAGGTADADAPKGRTRAATKDDGDEDEAPKPRTRASAKDKDKDEAPKPRTRALAKDKGKGIALADLVKEFGDFMSEGSEEDQDEAEELVSSICDYFKVERVSLLKESDYEEALGYLKQARSKGKITFDAGAEDEDEDEKPRRRRL